MDAHALDQYMLYSKVYLPCTSEYLSLWNNWQLGGKQYEPRYSCSIQSRWGHSISFSLQIFVSEEYGFIICLKWLFPKNIKH